ncbi:DMT family transporter [Actinocrispum wychmicini]|uniref:Drug/metabolite transporter (DMT)-like permease n=1 Tax=Actinocrispum wychmicini TaxID=1213861 RepID=A0A4R2J0M7_9PSEU|nr:EamA family transporter [Actinocrispum wychmicini]TCO49769.1 drug/metabolite transporter (DMT)-like permease [Actinocrispum wychmicini]
MTRTGWVLFALLGVIWGLPYLMIKVAVGGVSVPVLVFARTAIGAAILVPIAIRKVRWDALRKHWPWVLAFAVLEVVGPWALLSDAEHNLSSSMAGLLIAAVPIIGAVVVGFLGERLGVKQWAGLAVGFGGVALLAAPNLHGGDAWSIVEVLLTAIGYAVAPVIADRKLREIPSIVVTAITLTLAGLVYTAPAIATWPERMPDVDVLLALVGLAVVCTALGLMLFFQLIREAGPARAMVITYVNPVVAVAAGVLLLHEPLTLTTTISFVLILGGSFLATSRPRERVRASVEVA